MVNKRRGRPAIRRPADRLARKRRRPLRRIVGVAALASVVAAVAVTLWLTSSRGSDNSSAAAGQGQAAAGATNGAPNVTASAGGVEVAESSVDLGRVPLNTPVDRTFVLRNTGSERVSLGKIKIEALEGC